MSLSTRRLFVWTKNTAYFHNLQTFDDAVPIDFRLPEGDQTSFQSVSESRWWCPSAFDLSNRFVFHLKVDKQMQTIIFWDNLNMREEASFDCSTNAIVLQD